MKRYGREVVYYEVYFRCCAVGGSNSVHRIGQGKISQPIVKYRKDLALAKVLQ